MQHNHQTGFCLLRASGLYIDVCLLLSSNPRRFHLLRHNHPIRVCLLYADRFQTFVPSPHSTIIRFSLNFGVRAYLQRVCSHQYDPHQLPLCHFPLVGMCSLNVWVSTHTLGVQNHQSDRQPLHPYGHQETPLSWLFTVRLPSLCYSVSCIDWCRTSSGLSP